MIVVFIDKHYLRIDVFEFLGQRYACKAAADNYDAPAICFRQVHVVFFQNYGFFERVTKRIDPKNSSETVLK